MKALISIFKVRFALTLQYRMAAFAGMFTQFFFGFVYIMIYDAFFNSSSKTMPMTFGQTVSYIWLGQGLLGLLPWNGDRDVQLMIKSGDFAYELLRPIHLYNYWYFRILGQRVAGTILRAIPLFVTAALIIPNPYKLAGPDSVYGFFLFMISMSCSIILGGTITNTITISTLFTLGDGIGRLITTIVTIFSGMIVPLSFFPDRVQIFLKIQPFSGLVDAPYKFYLGIYHGEDIIFTLFFQLLWTIVFYLSGRVMIAMADKRIIVQGG